MASDTMQLCDDMNVADRVDQIMSLEPVIDKTAQTRSLQDSFTDLCSAAHGTNLAAACSALRNTNGQLVPVSVLGQLRASGATPEQYLGHAFWLIVGGQPWAAGSVAVCVGALAMHLCGDLAACKGAALNKQFQNPTDETVKSIPVGNPLYGKTVEEIKEEFADQVIGERLKIRGVFVAHPTNAEQDPSLLELVKELVRRIALEQRCDYSDIHVGLLRKEVATFKEALSGHREVARMLGERVGKTDCAEGSSPLCLLERLLLLMKYGHKRMACQHGLSTAKFINAVAASDAPTGWVRATVPTLRKFNPLGTVAEKQFSTFQLKL
ncbi:hypothetical protein AK812_SmicGene17109 [Symbiodinium microadriaticum]|uniref:Uncharacterized protein n=1 Tax=Symbiodinium microadriaticum TaxID=2951 RepID=A0A1Q9DYN8_SYMMI|nr:hypothetical protein AK812_SmicGene17109 [Symbiodinium microadriaticum]